MAGATTWVAWSAAAAAAAVAAAFLALRFASLSLCLSFKALSRISAAFFGFGTNLQAFVGRSSVTAVVDGRVREDEEDNAACCKLDGGG